MDKSLENAINAGLGDMNLLKNILQSKRFLLRFQQLQDVHGLGKNGDQIEPANLCFGQNENPL
jgi:hypothetical protein